MVRKKKGDIPGYEVLEKRVKQGKEGILVAVKHRTFQSIEEITNSDLPNIFTVRIKCKNEYIRVITLHAPQETDGVEDRTNFYEALATQVERCEDSGDKLIVLGDFNARLSHEDSKIVPTSPNGQLLHEVVEENQLQICNFSPKTVGAWTRIQQKNGTVTKSAIDYVLMSEDVIALMSSMVIDEEKIFCPYREKKTKSKKKIVFSDHCAIIMTLEVMPGVATNKNTSYKAWQYTDEGFSAYKVESEAPMDVNWSPDSTQAYDFWTREFNKRLAKCFSKRTVKVNKVQHRSHTANNSVRAILARLSKKGRIQRQIAKKYLERVVELETRQEAVYKTSRLKETMAKLSYEDKFSPNGYWKLKKAADKNLSTEMVYTIIKENGVEVSGESLIKEVYKEEFKHRLFGHESLMTDGVSMLRNLTVQFAIGLTLNLHLVLPSQTRNWIKLSQTSRKEKVLEWTTTHQNYSFMLEMAQENLCCSC